MKNKIIEEFDKRVFNFESLEKGNIREKCLKELREALANQKKKIGQDLLKIADDGEIEELRRVIVNYFHIKK